MLTMVLSVFFSIMSTVIMSYLTMNTQLGPWFAPIFVIVGVAVLSLFNRSKLFLEKMLFVIAAGSIGGMVGVCLGSTIPVLYFLHEDLFLSWSLYPLMFSLMTGFFVVFGALCAFGIVYSVKGYLLKDKRMSFPMSQFFYELLYTDRHINRNIFMAQGFLGALMWQFLVWVSHWFLRVPYIQLQVLPFMLTIGFLTGWVGTVPVVWGIGLHYFVVWVTPIFMSSQTPQGQVVITIVIGMLLSWLLYEFSRFLIHRVSELRSRRSSFLEHLFSWLRLHKAVLLSGMLMIVFLKFLAMPIMMFMYIVMAMLFLTYIIARAVGEVGVVDVQNFSWILIFPLMCLAKVSVFWLLLIATMGLLTFGIVIDLLFSCKIAQLVGVGYRRLFWYQLFGCFISACCVGFILWWYMYKVGLHKNEMVYSNALQLSEFMKYQVYDYRVVGLGMLVGFALMFLGQDMLCIAGAMLLNPVLGIALIIAGYVSSYVKDPIKWYPVWFGFYAGHSILVLLRGLG